MKKSFLIAYSNIRKAKGQTVAMIVLILLAAFMLNLWLMLSTDYKKNFDYYHDKLNAEHVTLALNSDEVELRRFLSETLEKDPRTAEYHIDDTLEMVGSFAYNGGEINTEFIILEKDQALNRPVGRAEIVEDGEFASGIYLPMLYDNSISVGETIAITIGNHILNYTVCGFLNSVMAGSHNCTMSLLMLTEDKYEELEELGYAPKSTLISVRIKDKSESENFETMLNNAVSSQYPALRILSNSYNLVSTSRYISQMICSGIVSLMAFLVTLIALVVIASNVINYIQEHMKNLGVLKAVGYKSSQILSALLIQFTGIALVTSGVGAGLSYCLFPAVNAMMISQTGIPYTMRFLPLPFAVTAALIGGTVFLTVWLSARRIKRIEPIVALRSGVQTHNFKRNHIPLEKTRASLPVALALKATFSGMKQNVTVCITMLVLSLAVVFSGLMMKNVIIDMQPFVDLIMGETADSCINVNTNIENEFLQTMRADERVSKIYLYHSTEVGHVNGIALVATLSNDFTEVNNQSCCIEGRFPKYDNEVAIAAKYAKENGLKIGDEITLTTAGNKTTYIISGYTQISNNLGKDCLMTRNGYEHMGTLQNASYYINLTDGTDIGAFHLEVNERFGNDINTTIDIQSILDGAAGIYVSLMTIIVIAILVLCIIIIIFVLYLLVRTILNNKKHDYGIMKALGFTTGQLILQTALSFMPTVILSMITGLLISSFLINPLTAVVLSGIGIVKCTFAIPAGFIIASGIGLILFTFMMVCLLSLKIKKIAPRALFSEE